MRLRKKKSIVAIDAGPGSLAVCQLTRRSAVCLHRWGYIEDPLRCEIQSEMPARALPIDRLTRLVEQAGLRGREASLALKPPDVSFQSTKLPTAVSQAPRNAQVQGLRLEAAHHMQCSPDELEVDFWHLPAGNRAGCNVMVVAVPRETLDYWGQLVEQIGLTLARVDVLPCAHLRTAWRSGIPGATDESSLHDQLWGVLDIGYSNACLTLALGNQCVYVRGLSVGGNSFTTAIRETLDVDYQTAESLKRQLSSPDQAGPLGSSKVLEPVIRMRTRSLAVEIERAFAYAMESYPEAHPCGLYLCGGGAKLAGVDQGLQGLLGIDVQRLDPCADLDTGRSARPVGAHQISGLATCVGLALGDLE